MAATSVNQTPHAPLRTHFSLTPRSSVAGKFVEIDFDTSGRVSGASIATYLLERCVGRQQGRQLVVAWLGKKPGQGRKVTDLFLYFWGAVGTASNVQCCVQCCGHYVLQFPQNHCRSSCCLLD